MLIRLMSDGTKNPGHYDKMIAIDGLPEEWIFNRRVDKDDKGRDDARLFLKDPWELDVTDNIPEGIRMKFQESPFEVWFETPQELRPGTFAPPSEIGFIRWMKKAYGLRLNLQTNGGKQMWDQIVDLLDRETPRSQRIPEAAVVGDRMQWTLQPSQVPYVKLTGTVAQVPQEQVQIIQPKKEARPNEYSCRHCNDIFDKERGRWMHERRKHNVKDPFLPQRKEVLV